MARMVTGLQLDAVLHERIFRLKEHISQELRFNQNSVGVSVMLSLLLDHWEQTPPTMDWLVAQAMLYPRRGRPRRSKPVAEVTPPKARHLRGHDVFWRRADKDAEYRVVFCKNCTMQWGTWDFNEPPAECPKQAGFETIYQLKIWKKNDLLVAGFEPDEVEWAEP